MVIDSNHCTEQIQILVAEDFCGGATSLEHWDTSTYQDTRTKASLQPLSIERTTVSTSTSCTATNASWEQCTRTTISRKYWQDGSRTTPFVTRRVGRTRACIGLGLHSVHLITQAKRQTRTHWALTLFVISYHHWRTHTMPSSLTRRKRTLTLSRRNSFVPTSRALRTKTSDSRALTKMSTTLWTSRQERKHQPNPQSDPTTPNTTLSQYWHTSFVFLWHASSDSAEVLADAWRRGPADRSWSLSCMIVSRSSWRVSVWSVSFDWREACLPSWCNRKHYGRVSHRYRFESRRGQWALFSLIPSALSFVFLWHTTTQATCSQDQNGKQKNTLMHTHTVIFLGLILLASKRKWGSGGPPPEKIFLLRWLKSHFFNSECSESGITRNQKW